MLASATPVNPADPSAPERILGEDGGRAYRRFLAWTVGDGFAMAVIEVRSPAQRRELLAWTMAEMPGTHVARLDEASGKPLRPLLQQALPSPGGDAVLVLTRLEDAPDRIKLFARINIQRDELARAFPVPWVVLIHPAAALEMQQHAPDFSDFAGLWLNEEPEEKAAHLEAFEQIGLESISLAAPAMHISASDGSANLLRNAYDAILLSKYNDAVDLLAQYDMHHPDARTKDPQRIQLDGLLLWLRGESSAALSQLEVARSLCDSSTDRPMLVGILEDIARIRAQQGDVDTALALHHEALQVYEELGERQQRAVTLSNIARLNAQRGDVDTALALHHEALQVYEELGERRSRALTLSNIARLNAQRGEVAAALALHHEALQVYEELGDRLSLAGALVDIARLRAQSGEFIAALALDHQALKIYEELGNPDGVAHVRWSIGEIALRQGDGDAALENMTASYDINTRLGRLDAICIVGIDLALVLVATGHTKEAITILTRSRDGFQRLGRPDYVQHVQELIDSAADSP